MDMRLVRELQDPISSERNRNVLDDAIEFAFKMHLGQTRFDGSEYINHPLYVATLVKSNNFGIDAQVVAVLHDVLEDTKATPFEVLKVVGGNADIFTDICKLTKFPGCTMEGYISTIKTSKIAMEVKLSDRYHNLSTCHHGTTKFIKKYIDETSRYYIPLSKGTNWEKYMKSMLECVERDYTKRVGGS